MDGFLKITGMVIFILALGAVVTLAVMTRGNGIALIVYAFQAMVGGAAIYALGAILNNLIAIREASERQAAALAHMSMSSRKDS
jgi:uncharacterized membrane-anchored protein